MVRGCKRSSATVKFNYGLSLTEVPLEEIEDSYRLSEGCGWVERDKWGNWLVTQAGEQVLRDREQWEFRIEEILRPHRRSNAIFVGTVLRGQIFKHEWYEIHRLGNRSGPIGEVLTFEPMNDPKRIGMYSLTVEGEEPETGDILRRTEVFLG